MLISLCKLENELSQATKEASGFFSYINDETHMDHQVFQIRIMMSQLKSAHAKYTVQNI